MRRMADDLEDLLDHFGPGPFVLVGHSAGGSSQSTCCSRASGCSATCTPRSARGCPRRRVATWRTTGSPSQWCGAGPHLPRRTLGLPHQPARPDRGPGHGHLRRPSGGRHEQVHPPRRQRGARPLGGRRLSR
ncbi:alpha/beta fold hydrolase [Streptomyces sp. NPDC056491]|uniref:alpha/beta fold hydrolase n=1 Tax=Streptomyces sp. NPDC056491 TaxID=3345837 RepID=UPI00367F9202